MKPVVPTQEANEPPICKKCEDEFSVPDGYDVTDYCNPCAQEVVIALLESHRELQEVLAKGPSLLSVIPTEQQHEWLKLVRVALAKAKEIQP